MPSTELTTPVTRRAGGLVADDYGHADAHPPIVLLHGLTFDRTIWRPLVTELHRVDPGRRVLAIDLPGHGESPDWPSYDLDRVPDALHRVIAEAGLAAPIVVGHSAGALGATIYAGQRPTRGVVNIDQPLQIDEFAGFVQSLGDRLRGPEFGAVWQMFYDSFHTELLPPAAQELVRSTCRPRQQVVLGCWQQPLDGQASQVAAQIDTAAAAISASGVPYLQVAGDEPAEGYREWLTRRLPAATIEVWAGSGHFPHLAHQAEFARLLAAFAR